MKNCPPLDAHTIIDSILEQMPTLAEVFNGHGMACVGCVFSRFHRLADAAAIYHLDMNQLIDELSHKCATLTDRESDAPSGANPVAKMR